MEALSKMELVSKILEMHTLEINQLMLDLKKLREKNPPGLIPQVSLYSSDGRSSINLGAKGVVGLKREFPGRAIYW